MLYPTSERHLINDRDELPISIKAQFDSEYVANISFAFDCKCFFGTVVKVLRRDGVVEGAVETKEEPSKQEQEV